MLLILLAISPAQKKEEPDLNHLRTPTKSRKASVSHQGCRKLSQDAGNLDHLLMTSATRQDIDEYTRMNLDMSAIRKGSTLEDESTRADLCDQVRFIYLSLSLIESIL